MTTQVAIGAPWNYLQSSVLPNKESMWTIHLPNVGLTFWGITITIMANMPKEATNSKANA
jgi:hypothetical protein